MKISSYLKKEYIIQDLKATNKKEAILGLSELLKNNQTVTDFDRFLADIFEREEMMTTGIGHSIAIPHARTHTVDNLIMAVGISKSGIDFDALDDQPVNIIFLIGAPAKKVGEYLKALAYLSRILMKESFRKEIMDASDPQTVIDLLARKEG